MIGVYDWNFVHVVIYAGILIFFIHNTIVEKEEELEMWANAQPDGRPAEYRWRPLLNAAV